MAFENNINFLAKDIHKFCNSPQDFIDKEKRALSVDGVELGEIEKIKTEFIRITATLAFDCDLEYQEYSDVKKIVKKLGLQIEKLDNDIVLFDAIKKLIVYLDLQIGSKVSFYRTFAEMLSNKELEYNYHQLKSANLYDFEKLLIRFYKKSYEKFYGKKYELLINNTYNIENDHKGVFNKERIIKLEKVIKDIKKIDIDKYSSYSEILSEILYKFDEIECKEDIYFVRKVISYLELNLGLKIEDKNIIKAMLENGELAPDYKNIVFDEPIDLEYLKEKFNYAGQVYRKGREK